MAQPDVLTQHSFESAIAGLTRADPDLSTLVDRRGPPPFWTRAPGFATLVHILLEQQVSLASAKAAFDRLQEATSPLTPAALLSLDDATMRSVGFSRQKMGYARGVAQSIVDGRLDLAGLATLSDEEVYAELILQRGIGPWTAQVYMLMALRRADIWPIGDLALVVAVQETKRLPQRPSADEMTALARPWQPWRAVAARLLWHHYLSTR